MSSQAKKSESKASQTKPASAKPTQVPNGAAAKSKPVLKPTGPQLQLDSEVARSIRQHARSHMKTEVCGVLIGENLDGIVEVQASIEALNATQAGTHVTFTQDAWEAIYKVKDEHYPEERIVGWYHSHPGFGVFLSEHDTFIHRNFFSSPDQVAWVYDPHTDEEGCFGWIDGEIHRVPSFSILDNSGDGTERTPKRSDSSEFDEDEESLAPGKTERRGSTPAWFRWTVTTLSYISALVVGFLAAWLLFPRYVPIPVNPFTGEPMDLSSAPFASPNPSVAPNPSASPNPAATPSPSVSPTQPTAQPDPRLAPKPGSASPQPGVTPSPAPAARPAPAKPAPAKDNPDPGRKK